MGRAWRSPASVRPPAPAQYQEAPVRASHSGPTATYWGWFTPAGEGANDNMTIKTRYSSVIPFLIHYEHCWLQFTMSAIVTSFLFVQFQMLLTLGDSSEGSEQRARMLSSALLSDMEAFKVNKRLTLHSSMNLNIRYLWNLPSDNIGLVCLIKNALNLLF